MESKQVGEEYQRGTKLFIGGVSWSTTDEGFKAFFEKYGPLEDTILMRTPDGKTRGFGFVTFVNREDADKVIAETDLELDGRKMDPKRAVPRGEGEEDKKRQQYQSGDHKTKKIFIGGISLDTTKEDFESHFGQYGSITDAIVMIDRVTGRSRGFGFVTFETEDSVDSAMTAAPHTIQEREVEIKRAIPKEAQMNNRGSRGYNDRGYDRRDGGYGRGYRGGYNPRGGRDEGYRGHRGGYGGGGYGRDDYRRGGAYGGPNYGGGYGYGGYPGGEYGNRGYAEYPHHPEFSGSYGGRGGGRGYDGYQDAQYGRGGPRYDSFPQQDYQQYANPSTYPPSSSGGDPYNSSSQYQGYAAYPPSQSGAPQADHRQGYPGQAQSGTGPGSSGQGGYSPTANNRGGTQGESSRNSRAYHPYGAR